MLCRWACQPTMATTYHRVQEPVRWLDEPVALRSENGRKTTGTAEEIAGGTHTAEFRTIAGLAIRHVHGCDVDGHHVGGHLCRASRMRNRTRRECGEECDKYQAGDELHERRLFLVLSNYQRGTWAICPEARPDHGEQTI